MSALREFDAAVERIPGLKVTRLDVVGGSGASLQEDLASKEGQIGGFLQRAQHQTEESNKQMGEAFHRTRGAINELTGGFGGLIPAVAGFTVYGAVNSLDDLQHEIFDLTKTTGLSAESSSRWVGAAKQVGLDAGNMQMAFRFLSRDIITAQQALDKHTASGDAAALASKRVAEAENNLTLATERRHLAEEKAGAAYDAYVAASQKYGEYSTQAEAAQRKYEGAVLSTQTALTSQTKAQDALTDAQAKASMIMSGLTKDGGRLQGALSDLGVSLLDQNGKAKDFDTLLREISDGFIKLQENDPSKVMGDAMAIFGRAGTSILPLLLQGSEGIKQLMQNTELAGQVFSASALQNGEENYIAMQKIKLAFRGLLNDVAKDLQPAVQWMGDHTETVKKFVEAAALLYGTHKGVSIFRDVLQDARDLLGVAGKLGGAASGKGKGGAVAEALGVDGARVFVTNWEMMRGGAGVSGPALPDTLEGYGATQGVETAAEVGAAAGSAGVLSKLGSLLGRGVGLLGSGAMVGGGVLAGNLAGGALGGLAGNEGAGQILGSTAGGALMGAQVGGPIGALVGAAGGLAVGAFENGDALKRGAARVGGAMRDWFESVGGDIKDAAGTTKRVLGDAVGNVGSWFENIGDDVQHGAALTKNFLGDVVGNVGSWFQSVGGDLQGFFGRVGGFFHSLTPEKIGHAVGAGIRSMFQHIEGAINTAQLFVIEKGGAAVRAVGGFFTGPFSNFFTGLWGRVSSGGGNAIGAIKDFFTGPFAGFFHGIPGHIKVAWDGATTATKNFFTGPFVGFFHGLPGHIADGWNTATSAIKNFFTGPFAGFFHDLPGHLADAFKKAASVIGDAISSFAKSFASTISGIAGKVGGFFSTAASDVGGFFKGAASDVGGFFGGLWNGITGGAQGGIITEPILGFGLKSGTSYTFGEAGNERILPMGGRPLPGGGPVGDGESGGQVTNVYVDLRNTQMWSTRDLDELVEKLGSRVAKVLAPNAGLRLQRI